MADRFPLIVDEVSRRIEELVSGDNLNLTDNGISIDGGVGVNGQFLQSTGSKVIWAFPENTVTKIKAGNTGTFISGEISFVAGPSGNISIDQNGGIITIDSVLFPSRNTASITTASIADGSSDEVQVILGKSYLLQKIETSAAAWITVYSDIASRNADALRNESTDPLPGSGVIAEVITDGASIQKITPGVVGWNDDNVPSQNAYMKVVNKSGISQAITITITYVKLEG